MRGYRKQKKHRIALLTVIFALIVFCIIAATMALYGESDLFWYRQGSGL